MILASHLEVSKTIEKVKNLFNFKIIKICETLLPTNISSAKFESLLFFSFSNTHNI